MFLLISAFFLPIHPANDETRVCVSVFKSSFWMEFVTLVTGGTDRVRTILAPSLRIFRQKSNQVYSIRIVITLSHEMCKTIKTNTNEMERNGTKPDCGSQVVRYGVARCRCIIVSFVPSSWFSLHRFRVLPFFLLDVLVFVCLITFVLHEHNTIC